MKLETTSYTYGKGWAVDPLPDMDSAQTLIFVFAAPYFTKNPELLKELAGKYSKSSIIGCSTAGEIHRSNFLEDSLSVAFVQFDKTPFKIVKATIENYSESYTAGMKIAKQLDKPGLKSVIVFSNGLNVNGSEFAKGLNEYVAKGVTVTGGLAGDGCRFQETSVIFNNQVLSSHIVAVGLYGDHIQIGHGCQGGWDIFGPERLITRSEKNVLYELDDQPALKLYKEYLGEKASGLPATGLLFPLALRINENDTRHLVRTILAVDEKKQSLTFAGDIPVNYRARLMRSNMEHLISSAAEAGETALERMGTDVARSDKPCLSIAVSCVGRKLVLGERTEEEIESVFATLPPQTHQVGFYSYGELSPYDVGGCDLHNQTMTITILHES